jgi:OOP family OmpA-OmpF porin
MPYVSMAVTPSTVVKGQSATLTWMSINATNLVLSGVGPIGTDGSMAVWPAKNAATYMITATGTNGTMSASVSVVVKPPPPIQFPPH